MIQRCLVGASVLVAAIVNSAGFAQAGQQSDAGPSTSTQPSERSERPAAPQRPNRPNAARGANIPVPDDIQLVRDVIYATVPGKDGRMVELRMDCAFLKQSDGEPMPVVMYIHGGGWSQGDRSVGLPLCLAFARGGYFACTVQYRLSGEAVFPAQIHDVKSAVRFLRANADKLVIDPDRIGVWGHSAGGHLSALLGVSGDVPELEGEVGERDGAGAVQAVVTVSGPSDLARLAPGGNGGPMIAGLLGGTVDDKRELASAASPVTHVNAGDAPFLIIQGGRDRLVPDEQAEILRDALNDAGVTCEYLHIPDADHGVRDARAFEAVARFFDEHLQGNAMQAMEQFAQRLAGAARDGGARRGQPNRDRATATAPATQPQ